MPFYKIRPGHSFRVDDGSVKQAGDVIELGSDVAQMHIEKIQFVSMGAPAPQSSQTSAPVDEALPSAADKD